MTAPRPRPRPIRVVVVDDDDDYLQTLVGLLAERDDVEVIAAVSDGSAAIAAVDGHPGDLPDVVLLDIEMPGVDGVDATRAIRKSHPTVRIVLLTAWGYSEVLGRALAAGASSCLDKSMTADQIADALVGTVCGATIMWREAADTAAGFSRRRMARQAANEAFVQAVADLPPSLRAVYDLITQGLSNRQIAAQLSLSQNTVNTYATRILRATGATSRTDLTVRDLTSRL